MGFLSFDGLALSGATGGTVGHVATPEIEMAHGTGWRCVSLLELSMGVRESGWILL